MAGLYWHEHCLRDPSCIPRYSTLFGVVDSVNFLSDSSRNQVIEKLEALGMASTFRQELILDIGPAVLPTSNQYTANHFIALKPAAPYRLCMVARFSSYQKRQDLLVRALSLLPADLPVHLSLIGAGEEQARLQDLAKGLGLADRIDFVPFMPREALWARLKGADLLCHCVEYEGVSKVILESMALGLPVLASDVMPINHEIRDGQTGYLCANTPEAWAQKLTKVLLDKSHRQTLSQAAQIDVARRYDRVDLLARYEAHFAALIA